MRKTMDYPMAATQIKSKEWDDIMTLINRAALPRSGLVRTFPHAILYGPKKFQGSGQQHPFYMQELLHIYEFVKEINQYTQQGKQYCITLEQLKMETGFPGPFTQVPYTSMAPSTTTSMIKNIWKFCHTHKISIRDDFGSPPSSVWKMNTSCLPFSLQATLMMNSKGSTRGGASYMQLH